MTSKSFFYNDIPSQLDRLIRFTSTVARLRPPPFCHQWTQYPGTFAHGRQNTGSNARLSGITEVLRPSFLAQLIVGAGEYYFDVSLRARLYPIRVIGSAPNAMYVMTMMNRKPAYPVSVPPVEPARGRLDNEVFGPKFRELSASFITRLGCASLDFHLSRKCESIVVAPQAN